MAKSAEAFRTISEVADALGTQPHVLRFWESKFTQVKPVKRAGGRRYYRPADVLLLAGIKRLLHDDGVTIKGVQKVLRERGVKYVAALAPMADAPEPGEKDTTVVAFSAPAEPAPEAAPEPAPIPAPAREPQAAHGLPLAPPTQTPDAAEPDTNQPAASSAGGAERLRMVAALGKALAADMKPVPADLAPLYGKLSALHTRMASQAVGW